MILFIYLEKRKNEFIKFKLWNKIKNKEQEGLLCYGKQPSILRWSEDKHTFW